MIVMGMVIISGLTHFISGYHYAPRVVKNFDDDLTIISERIETNTPLYITNETPNHRFYNLLAKYSGYTIYDKIDGTQEIFATFSATKMEGYSLKEIITSPKSRNSDRLYIYSKSANN
jgi:hypothetical protein